jgi:hypothetical protein
LAAGGLRIRAVLCLARGGYAGVDMGTACCIDGGSGGGGGFCVVRSKCGGYEELRAVGA